MQISRGARRALAAVVAAGLALPVLVGCGFKTQTDEVYQPAVGTDARDSRVDVLGNVIVSPKTGEGVVVTTLVNNDQDTADTLESVSGTGSTTVTLPAPVVVAPGSSANLAKTGGLAITGSAVDPDTSAFVTLTFTFKNADPVTVGMPVVRPDGPYAGLGTPAATPSAPNSVASAGATGAIKPSPSASASPTS